MSFFRSVLGDVPTADMGICYAHEHVVLRSRFVEERFPELILAELDAIARELQDLRRLGVRTMIDAMPLDSGRATADLIEISQRTDIQIVAATGLHLRMYYPPDHWYDSVDEDTLTQRFIDEIEDTIWDEETPVNARAGVIKVAGGKNQLTDLERRNFRAAGRAQHGTGCPILTHTEQGTAALEQVRILQDAGADLGHVVLSHLDRNEDFGYQREVLQTGVKLEYDSAFRWKGEPNLTFDLLTALAPEFPHAFVLGMDAAKSAYWSSYGGRPGLGFLLEVFRPRLREAGLGEDLLDNIFIHNPASAYSFGKLTHE